MSLETEIVLDRRQLRRRLSLWRGLAITGLVIALGGYLLSADETSGVFAKKHVARISFTGTITESRAELQMLSKIRDAKNVAGVIVFVNSTGGNVLRLAPPLTVSAAEIDRGLAILAGVLAR